MSKVKIKRTCESDCKAISLNIFDRNEGGIPNDINANIEFCTYIDNKRIDVCTWFSTSRKGDECQQVNIDMSRKEFKKYVKKLVKFKNKL